MMFDPYRKWLGIPEDQRPPNHYQLLGIAPDELDPEVIEAAAVRQSAFVRNFQSGKYGTEATRLLTEIAAARLCLLNAAKRAAYDAELTRQRSAPRRAAKGGSNTELGLAPLDDDLHRSADSQPSAPAATPPLERPAARHSPIPSQSSGRYRDLVPPAAAPSPPSPMASSPAPLHRTQAPGGITPPVELGRLLQQGAPTRARPARLGGPRPTAYAKPQNPAALLWQIPLAIVVFFLLLLLANAVGRKIAVSRQPSTPAAVESSSSS